MAEIALERSLSVGLGYSSHSDAFQCGREAAQIAKGQIPEGPYDLVLALGPGNIHFQSFVEGVRLVTGEEALVGVPVPRVYAGELAPPDCCAVLVLKASGYRFSMSGTSVDPKRPLAAVTSLLGEFRRLRGQIRDQFEYHGLLVFRNQMPSANPVAPHLAADAGLESWSVTMASRLPQPVSLICRNMAVADGLVGVECLSNDRWGLGTVSMAPFMNQPDIFRNAVKSAIREAMVQIDHRPPAFGIMLFDFPVDRISDRDVHSIFEYASSLVKNMPLIGIPTDHQFIRHPQRFMVSEKHSITVLVAPL